MTDAAPEQDLELNCGQCGDSFVFSRSEQEFFTQKGFVHPKRCRDCRSHRRLNRTSSSSSHTARSTSSRDDSRPRWEVACSACGEQALVPFKPVSDRPVYCESCFRNR